MIYYGLARSAHEIAAAQTLAARVFGEILALDPIAQVENKTILWNEPRGAPLVVVAVLEDGRVVGVARLLKRTLRRGGQTFSCMGFSSIAVDPALRGQGLSGPLMEAALRVAREAGAVIGLLFGRRVVDHFYTQFGFHGLSSYSRLRIQPLLSGDGVVLRPMLELTDELLFNFQTVYSQCYGSTFGWIERSSEMWRFQLLKMDRKRIDVTVIDWQQRMAGYLIRHGGVIHEIAVAKGVPWEMVLAQVASVSRQETLVVEVPPEHPVLTSLAQLDITLETRQCDFGGHMVIVLDENKVCQAAEERVRHNARRAGLAPALESWDGVTIQWDGVDAAVHRTGPMDFPAMSRLLGAKTLTQTTGILDPALCFHVSMPDHF